ELPGVAPGEVRLDLANGVLTLAGEKKSSQEEKGRHFIRVERSHGSFSRSFTLPDDADGDKITATAKDGVLTIAIPRR
ncbi:Hsp20/alpha crystallin family protein, partial [Pseudomonas aeruginosa]|uniref:Hsp20/alpha crystallin family protein n=1 Tax=Pseudomonas aeruginosa TaxID=287 RepID=UPI002B4087C7